MTTKTYKPKVKCVNNHQAPSITFGSLEVGECFTLRDRHKGYIFVKTQAGRALLFGLKTCSHAIVVPFKDETEIIKAETEILYRTR